MSMQDPIADMLTLIRNAQHARKKSVVMPSSTVKVNIAKELQEEGFIGPYEVIEDGVKKTLSIELKYYLGKPVIDVIKRVSKPGLRIYKSSDELPKVLGGLGVALVSTSKGIMSDKKARALGHGGEIICIVS